MPTAEEIKAQKAKETLAKMMALANDPGTTQGERDNAMQRAIKYAAKRGLELAQLEAVQAGIQAMGIKIRFKNPGGKEKGRLYNIVLRAYNCRALIINQKLNVWHAFGFKSDLEWADKLYSILWEHGLFELEHAEIPEYVHKRTFSHSFWVSYTRRIRERLAEAKKETISESAPGAALVLVNREEAAANLMNETYTKIGHVRGPTAHSMSGWVAGETAANTADLGRARIE